MSHYGLIHNEPDQIDTSENDRNVASGRLTTFRQYIHYVSWLGEQGQNRTPDFKITFIKDHPKPPQKTEPDMLE